MKYAIEATVEETTLYNVFANTDMIEGRGAPVLIGVFLNGASAKRWAEGRGVYGGNAEVREDKGRIVRIGGDVFVVGARVNLSVEDAEKQERQATRERALAKLTAAEREALGVK